MIKNLRKEEFDLSLRDTKVAIGNSMGKLGSKYIKGRVDKACLEIAEPIEGAEDRSVHIALVAEICDPYAVYVRNKT